MVAHLDSVTSLAVDPNGLYLMSGSEYSAVCCQRSIFNIQNQYIYSLSEKDQLSIQDMGDMQNVTFYLLILSPYQSVWTMD